MLLLVFLVGTIVFVIQRKEVRTIFEEARNRGILTAQYIANMNLRALVLWDEETLRTNIEGQADDKLVYIVFYDRDGKPRAANRLVAANDDIMCCSRSPRRGAPRQLFDPDAGGPHPEPEAQRPRDRAARLRHRVPDAMGVHQDRPVPGGHAGRRPPDPAGPHPDRPRRPPGRPGWARPFLAKRITRPLKELVEGTVRISRGDFSHRIRLESADEIGDLARSFNEMTGRLLEARERMEAANRKLVQAEKLASIGRLAATIAHEIRNPLTSVKLNIQRIAESEHLDELEREHLDICQEGIGQIEKFIKELLEFHPGLGARPRDGSPSSRSSRNPSRCSGTRSARRG